MPPELATKRALLAVSRSIESLAGRAAPHPGPHVVLALFQDERYFGFAVDRFVELAQHATVVAGYVGRTAPPAPVHHLAFEPEDQLADEWSVLLVSPVGVAGLVALDAGEQAPSTSLERGRLFRPELSTEAPWVVAQVERILASGCGQLPWSARRAIEDAVAAATDVRPPLPERVLRDELLAGWWRSLTYASQHDGLEELAFVDPLTQAYNRRFLDRYLSRLGPRAPHLAALTIDLDRFKALNDTYGHAAGDTALRQVADAVRAVVRPDDVLVRTGGDEFVLLLPAVSEVAATERAWSIVQAIVALRLPAPADGARLGASVGVGIFPATALDLCAVDDAMYAAKRGGTGVALVGTDGTVTHVEPPGTSRGQSLLR